MKSKHGLEAARNYLVGGKERDGSFLIYEISWDAGRQRVRVTERKPQPPHGSYGVSLAVPIGEPKIVQKVFATIQDMISQARDHDELKHKIASVIYSIAQLDDTVGPDAIALTIL